MIRRFVALTASAFLLSLNVLGVDRACGPSHETAPAGEHTGHSQHHTPAPVQHDAPTKCCDALSSCGMSLSLGGEVSPSATQFAVLNVPNSAVRSPSSVPRAPEPPPPKA